jgi:hypothetical protein
MSHEEKKLKLDADSRDEGVLIRWRWFVGAEQDWEPMAGKRGKRGGNVFRGDNHPWRKEAQSLRIIDVGINSNW